MKKNITLTINYETYELARKKIKNMSALFELFILDMLLNDNVPDIDNITTRRLLNAKLDRLEKKEKLVNYVKNNSEEYQKYMTEQHKIANVKWTR